jgi:hypothetical protein
MAYRAIQLNWLTLSSTVLIENLTFLHLFQKFPTILLNPKVHYRAQNSPPLTHNLSEINPVLPIASSLRSILILSYSLCRGASRTMGSGSFPGGKAAGAWCWPPPLLLLRSRECRAIPLHPLVVRIYYRVPLPFYLCRVFPSGYFPLGFPTILYVFLISPIRVTKK